MDVHENIIMISRVLSMNLCMYIAPWLFSCSYDVVNLAMEKAEHFFFWGGMYQILKCLISLHVRIFMLLSHLPTS